MAAKQEAVGGVEGMLRAFSIHNRKMLDLIDAVDDAAWDAAREKGKGRTIATLFAHLHSVRLMWLKAAKRENLPASVEKGASKFEVKRALNESEKAIVEWVQPALETTGRVANFKPDAWSFVAYLIAHESHHRGQVLMLAKEAGQPIAADVSYGQWDWSK